MNPKNKVTGELSSITTYDPVTGEITGLVPIGNTNLGSNANVIITGGNVGEVLTTDGAGNLSWSAGGSGSYSNVDANAFMAGGLVGDIIPAGNNVANLGSSANQFKDLYLSNATMYFNGVPLSVGNANGVANTLLFNSLPVVTSDGNTQITTTGNVDGGNITANGTIAANGNIIANTGYYFIGDGGQLSNITISAGSAITDGNSNVEVTGSTETITMGANGVPNVVVINESNATFIGNVVAGQYLYSNGTSITVNYANSNVFSYLQTYDGDLPLVGNITADGNITSNTGYYFLGDGGLLSNVAVPYGNSNVETLLSSGNVATEIISTANVNGANINVGAGGELSFDSGGNIYSIPTGGLAGTVTINGINDRGISLTAGGPTPGSGYSQLQWVQDVSNYDPYSPSGSITNWVYVQNDGTRIENFDLLNAPGYSYSWLFGTDGVLTAAGDITTPGNVTANFFIGDGGLLSNITGVGGYSNSNVATYLPTYNGNLGNVDNIIATGNINTLGDLAVSGNASATYFIGNGSQLTGLPAVYGNSNVAAYLPTYTGNLVGLTGNVTTTANVTASRVIADSANITANVTAGNVTAGNVNATANVSASRVNASNAVITSNITAGNMTASGTVTGAIISTGTGNVRLSGTSITATSDTITIDPLGTGTPAGNLIVQGNMQVAGTLTYNNITNATTNDLTWIAANNAINQAAASGGGLAVGPLGAYAEFTFNATSNAWQSSLPIIATDGINANGALSGATTGDFTGNVTADYFIGNGSQLTGLPASYANSDVADYLASNANVVVTTTGNITTTGNVEAAFFIGDGGALSNIAASSVTWANVTDKNDSGGPTEIALGQDAGTFGTQGANAVAIGTNAGRTSQGGDSIAIGKNSAQTTQGSASIAVGVEAGLSNQGTRSIAIGPFAGQFGQGANAIAIGQLAGVSNQSANSIILNAGGVALNGANAGLYVQPVRNDTGNITNAVYYNTSTKEITYGPVGGSTSSIIANGTSNVSIAASDGNISLSVAGNSVGTFTATRLALGINAGSSGQLANAVAVGSDAGKTNQQAAAIAIGFNAGSSSQGANAIAIGPYTGGINQAANSISIGANAQTSAAGIVLNATGANLLGNAAGFYVAPMRNDTAAANTAQVVTYNTTSNELTYANTLNLAGSITGGDFIAGNIANTTAAKTRIAQFGANSYIQTGNGVAGTTGNIIFSPWADATAKVVVNTTTGNITANNIGNITPINLNGNAATYLDGTGTWVNGNGTRNITKVDQTYGYRTQFMIADGRLFVTKANGGNMWGSALNPNDQGCALEAGINNMYEIPFMNEDEGTIVDAGLYGASAYALFANGNLYTWGYNGYGQLGIGSTTDSRFPVLSNTGVAQVYVSKSQNQDYGIQRIVIRKTNNTFWGCGHDGQYQFGLGTNTIKTSWTSLPWIPTDVLSVWMLGGDLGNIFIQKADGSIWVTGYNGYGQLGVNNTNQPTTPQSAPLWLGGDSTMRIQTICYGGNYASNYMNLTMLLDNGTTSRVVGAGANNWGSLGIGNTVNSQVPVAPIVSTGFTGRVTKLMSAGSAPRTVYALMATGEVYSWGYNAFGQVGNGTFTDVTSPYLMTTGVLDMMGEVLGYTGDGYNTPSPYFKRASGWWACGYNGYGNLGDGTTNNQNTLVRLRVPKNVNFKFFGTLGNNNAITRFGVTTDNKIWAWGYNGQGAVDPNATSWQAVQPLEFAPPSINPGGAPAATVYAPAFSAVSGGGSVTITTAYTDVQVPFPTVELDTGGWYSTSTNRYTPQKSGWYQINAVARPYTGGGTVEGNAGIRKNGVVIAASGSLGSLYAAVSRLVYCNGTTDYIDVAISTASPGSAGQNLATVFNGFWVRP